MRVQIAQRHCDVPKSVLKRTEEQLEKLVRYEPRLGSAEVVYNEEKHARTVEVILHIDGNAPIIANADGGDFRSALDKVLGRVTRMLKEQRSRRRDHQAPKLSEAAAE